MENHYRDEVNDPVNENDAPNNMISNNKTTRSKSFEYKTKLIESTKNDDICVIIKCYNDKYLLLR